MGLFKVLYVSGVRVAVACQHTKGVLSAYHLYEWQLELVNARSLTDTELRSIDSTRKAHSAAVTAAIPLTVQNKYLCLRQGPVPSMVYTEHAFKVG